MRKVADTLYLLASFNVRTGMISKALSYSAAGLQLFPDNLKLIEIHAYALLLNEDVQGAEDVLARVDAVSRNLQLLRSKTAILLKLPKPQTQERIRGYLAH